MIDFVRNITKYTFSDWTRADGAAGKVYESLKALGFDTCFENLEGHAHQMYYVYPKGAGSRNQNRAVMRFEYNGIETPPYVAFDFGTSWDKHVFAGLATVAAAEFGGIEAKELDRK